MPALIVLAALLGIWANVLKDKGHIKRSDIAIWAAISLAFLFFIYPELMRWIGWA